MASGSFLFDYRLKPTSELKYPWRYWLVTVTTEWEPWWSDIYRGKLLIRPPELLGNPAGSHITTKQEELAKEMMHFALRNICFIRWRTWGGEIFTSPPKEGVLRFFYRLWPGLNPRTLGPVASTLITRPPRTTVFRITGISKDLSPNVKGNIMKKIKTL
jgi:hypothetical protein